ncbi:MAG: hypothetical protein JNK38_01120 [Acidobacteria bacterium]|nr:hypothetical protein [Acidobacteriota bacterium]
MPNLKPKPKRKPATIEQTIAAYVAENQRAVIESAAPIKKQGISPEKLRAIIGAGAFGVMFAAQSLSSKDPDNAGIEDYFARKLQGIAFDMQAYAMTGQLPQDFQ